ncbi:hypothetical protein [Streptomyces sp. NPDC088725]|uniref:hypothetical protein n=1 Tax=Streptomyces sp. NPDC088725 TaxID=3365873 RepID=UPI00380D79F6
MFGSELQKPHTDELLRQAESRRLEEELRTIRKQERRAAGDTVKGRVDRLRARFGRTS